MAAVQRGLGRGLDALFKGIEDGGDAPDQNGIVRIPIDDIRPNPHQPRRDFEDGSLQELADSIRSSGVLQPILVRPVEDDSHRFELVAGERRWRASQLAGQSDIPAMVRELSDEESLAIALIENLQREDLNPIEEALGMKRLQEEFGLKQDDLAARVGKSRPAIANTLRLLQLPDDIQKDIRQGRLSAGHGRSLLAIADDEARSMLRQRCVDKGLSVREAEAQAAYWKKTGALPGDEAPKSASRGRGGSQREIPEDVREVQQRLAQALGMPVAIRGTLDKGRMVLGYADAAQFETLLQRLGASESAEAMVGDPGHFMDSGSEPPEIADLPPTALEDALADAQVDEPVGLEPSGDEEVTDGESMEIEENLHDDAAPTDPVDAMLSGQGDDDAQDLAAMLGDDDDEGEGDDEAEPVDFDDDELAELDKALDEILDETKNA